MKNTLTAVIATCTAMLATSGIVVFATAATRHASDAVMAETSADLEPAIARQLHQVKARLHLPDGPTSK